RKNRSDSGPVVHPATPGCIPVARTRSDPEPSRYADRAAKPEQGGADTGGFAVARPARTVIPPSRAWRSGSAPTNSLRRFRECSYV
ncbi:MAG TPA: hypothetical protein VJS19_04205, partial [Candidatus Dormibacteraeota bacterium]|nr:hypothetical protein [Candidatus Dormibacteraeota bacterium]